MNNENFKDFNIVFIYYLLFVVFGGVLLLFLVSLYIQKSSEVQMGYELTYKIFKIIILILELI